MKKIILSALALCAFTFASAQIKTDAGTFTKPTAGSTQLEVSFTPNLAGGPMFANPGVPGVPTTGMTLRKFSSETKAMRYSANVSFFNPGTKNAAGDNNPSTYTIAVGMGIENHMKGSERLSTFWGYQGSLMLGKDAAEASAIGVGAQLFTGCDYYIMPNIYLGAEVNFGLSIVNAKPKAGDGTTSIALNPGINPNLRLGWRF